MQKKCYIKKHSFIQHRHKFSRLIVSALVRRCYLTFLSRVVQRNLLNPWSRFLLENLTGLRLAQKFPTFYGTRRFITAFTSSRHLSLSRASSFQSIPLHPTSWRSNLILYSHLHLDLLSQRKASLHIRLKCHSFTVFVTKLLKVVMCKIWIKLWNVESL